MGSPADLSLDCKPHSYSTPVKPLGDQTEQTQKLEDFIARLEEERLKIDAFKRELPLCMQLLNKEMEASRQQLQNFRTNQRSTMVLEEFISVKNSNSEGSEKVSEKSSWMTTAQLWSQSNGRGAFLPFSRERKTSASSTPRVLPELALGTNGTELEDKKCTETGNGVSCSFRRSENSSMVGDGGAMIEQTNGERNSGEAKMMNTTQTHRKARRCWSPDLHRRFVNALQMLGGSQVATPKQIRELMKVDGLTNDEVKSHLQKYRLHTRRPGPSPQAVGAAGPQVVVLGGIWVPPGYATAAAVTHTTGPAIYGAHSGVPQDLYPPPLHVQLHHPTHNFHHQHPYKASSQTHSSPESNGRPAGDDSETIEDGKSESSNCNKGDSGKSGGERKERKDLASLRDDGEESNGSEITLKF